ncbi:MAG: LptF/LptG family permease [bacterium]|nr:MAG: LptF/LptG family permease [bacterium]
MRIIDRYILRNHIGPYFFGIAIITFVFVMDFIFRYLDLFIGKGVDFLVVLEFFVLSLGHMFALIIPMAVMPATLMAFGQLSSENEVTALKAMGISLYRMILPALVAAVILSVALVYYNNRILPESNHRLMNLMIDIGKMKPTIEIKENIFSDAFKGYTILVREKDDKTGRIEDVQIFEKKKGGIPRTITAARGKMTFNEEENILRFELEDGEIHEMPEPADITTYLKTHFKNYTLNIRDSERKLERSDRSHRGDREMSAAMMQAKIEEIRRNMEVIKDHMHQVAIKPVATLFAPALPELAPIAEEPVPDAPVPTPIPPPGQARERKTEGQEEKVLQILENESHILESNRNQINRYGVEIHKKYSIPFSCIIFVLLGAPLAIRSGKKGMTMAIGFSILFFLVYYVFLISGEKLADRRFMSPWIAMWMPNIVFSVAAVLLLHRTVKESQTINWDRLNLFKRWRNRGPTRDE